MVVRVVVTIAIADDLNLGIGHQHLDLRHAQAGQRLRGQILSLSPVARHEAAPMQQAIEGESVGVLKARIVYKVDPVQVVLGRLGLLLILGPAGLDAQDIATRAEHASQVRPRPLDGFEHLTGDDL